MLSPCVVKRAPSEDSQEDTVEQSDASTRPGPVTPVQPIHVMLINNDSKASLLNSLLLILFRHLDEVITTDATRVPGLQQRHAEPGLDLRTGVPRHDVPRR